MTQMTPSRHVRRAGYIVRRRLGGPVAAAAAYDHVSLRKALECTRQTPGYIVRRRLGPSAAAYDQTSLRWFETAFAGWITRRPALRQRLLDSLGTDQFGEAYKAWSEAEIDKGEPPSDLRQEREAFMRALCAAGGRDISPASFYWISRETELFRLEPERFPQRGAIKEGSDLTKALKSRAQGLMEELQAVGPSEVMARGYEAVQRMAMMGDLQRRLSETILGRALRGVLPSGEPSELMFHAFADVERCLNECLDDWGKRYGDMQGRPPNMAADDLVHHLAGIYRAMGGQVTATWEGTKEEGYPRSLFARFLTLIYAALPSTVRYIASESPYAFIDGRAKRVLLDRKKGIGPSSTVFVTPVTDSAVRAALELLPEDEAEAKRRGVDGILLTKDQLPPYLKRLLSHSRTGRSERERGE
jgi:hypothetical protein